MAKRCPGVCVEFRGRRGGKRRRIPRVTMELPVLRRTISAGSAFHRVEANGTERAFHWIFGLPLPESLDLTGCLGRGVVPAGHTKALLRNVSNLTGMLNRIWWKMLTKTPKKIWMKSDILVPKQTEVFSPLLFFPSSSSSSALMTSYLMAFWKIILHSSLFCVLAQ